MLTRIAGEYLLLDGFVSSNNFRCRLGHRLKRHLLFCQLLRSFAVKIVESMKEALGQTRAKLVCTILEGSWRSEPNPPLCISQSQLDEVTPLLYGSGAAALGWRRLRHTELQDRPSAVLLQQAYRLQSLQSAIHEENIQTVFRLLRESSIEPILVKGWAAAGLYPERALRPYGDIDLCCRAADQQIAKAVLAGPAASGCWADLHSGFSELKDRNFEQLFERSRTLPLGDSSVRVLSAEDHLALLAIHLLKHGAWRPLWLCDIAAAVEALPRGFNWEVCLGSTKRHATWIGCVIGLANRLLGAQLDQVPLAVRNQTLPKWLVTNVLKEWESPFAGNQPPMRHPLPMMDHVRHPMGIWQALQDRWPNPIIATISVNGSLNGVPRFPYQLANCISRIASFLAHLPRELRRSSPATSDQTH
jgi:hypothetical protein